MRPNRPAKKGASRLVRTIRSLVYISLLGVVLAVYNAVSLHRDVGLAIGPQGPAQEQFFRDAADRPDITTFFKNLTPARRLTMSRNIGRYTDPELAQLCGKCLDTFDPAARAALTASLSGVAKLHPNAVAIQLKLPGSFQQLGIAAALRKAGPAALPLVAAQFGNADARPNAVAYLVASGTPAIAATLPYLSDKNKDIRQAAADALGKLRARAAVAPLLALYSSSPEAERLSYLTALAGIGDPSTEGLMTQNLADESLPSPHRAQAALGLGAIGTTSALTTLWSFTTALNKDLQQSTISALQLAGDPALKLGASVKTPSATLLLVAEGIRTPYADSVIQNALITSPTDSTAAQAAASRPALVPTLTAQVKKLDATTQGDVIDAILRALTTTTEGRAELKAMQGTAASSPLGALAARRLSLVRG